MDVVSNGDINEILLLPEGGGCKHNLQLIGRLLTLLFECNIDPKYVIQILEKTDPCPAPTSRMNREKLLKEEVGVGGCSKIILQAITEVYEKINKEKESK